tara:strand:- start:335 stop:814 length:480 start_codon:yes stop_codon:yes gene_type:complete
MTYNLSLNIKRLIAINNLNQSDFGKIISSKGNTVSNWINGVANPPFDKVIEISKKFKVSLDVLVFGNIGTSNKALDSYVQENHPHLFNSIDGDNKKELLLQENSANDEIKMGKLVRWLLDHDTEVMKSAIYSIYIASKQKDYLDEFLKNDINDDLVNKG